MLAKPSRLDRDVAKWERRVTSASEKRKRERAEAQAWRVLSLRVEARDKGCCRVCTCQTTAFGKGDPRLWGAAHHIVYSSAGGPDEMSNLIWLCRRCHDAEHRHELSITGTADALVILRPR